MEIRSTAGMAMLYAVKQNDRDTPNHLIKPKIPPEPLEQGGAGGIFCCYSAAIFSGRD
mgnify:CR=1 FL=1